MNVQTKETKETKAPAEPAAFWPASVKEAALTSRRASAPVWRRPAS